MNTLEEYDYTLNKLKLCKLRGFEGYKVDKMLSIPAEEVLVGYYKEKSFFSIFKTYLSTILRESYYYDFDTIKNADVVLFYSHCHANRPDYVNFMKVVAASSDSAVLFSGTTKREKFKSIKINLVSINLFFLPLSWQSTFRKTGIHRKFWQNFMLSLLACYRWKSLLEKNQDSVLSIKGMVSIFDAREYENVFTQFLSHHNIPTATLQHGHYGSVYYKDANLFYLGMVYKGFVSDYFFLWGESAYRNAINGGISTEQLVKVGSPYLINPQTSTGQKGVFGLLFDGDDEAIPDNTNMYNIVSDFVKEHNIKLLVKLHPNDNPATYSFINERSHELFIGDLESFASSIETAICCNTSCMITMLIWGKPLIHYAPVYMSDMYSELKQYSFSDTKELNELYEKQISPSALLFHYTEIDNVKEKYKRAFNQLINKK